jgi:hypothetical protein
MTATTALYKVLGNGQTSYHGGSGKWTKNRWRSVSGDLMPCENGLHLCRRQDLLTWLGPEIWEAEYEGELVDAKDKVVVRRARIVRKLDTWNQRTSRLFAADCAEKVLPIFEKQYPNDERPREAIEAARAYARGEIGNAASDAARAAAWAAARYAASDAAWGAARVAASHAASQWATDRLFDYLEGRAS